MASPNELETAPKPTRITDPYAVLTGEITRDPVAHKITHEPIIVNQQELDESVEEVDPFLGLALRMGVGLKDGDFECSGNDLMNVVSGAVNICGSCLLEVREAGNIK